MPSSLSFSLLLFLSLLSFSSAQTTATAAAILSATGYKSMSLALNLAADSLNRLPPSLTVLAPSDAAFAAAAGQPSQELLRFHILPAAVPLRSLKSLPSDSKIATLLPGSFITVTTSFTSDDVVVSVNNVTTRLVYEDEDGGLVILGLARFLTRMDQNTPEGVQPAEGQGDTPPGAKREEYCPSLEQLLKAIDGIVPRRALSGDTPPGANQGKPCVSCCSSDRVTSHDFLLGVIYSVIGTALLGMAVFSYNLLRGKAPGVRDQANEGQMQMVANPNRNQGLAPVSEVGDEEQEALTS